MAFATTVVRVCLRGYKMRRAKISSTYLQYSIPTGCINFAEGKSISGLYFSQSFELDIAYQCKVLLKYTSGKCDFCATRFRTLSFALHGCPGFGND